MKKDLDVEDIDFILESLRYTKKAFEEYDKYPNYEFKQKRILEAQVVISKVENLKRTFNEF